MPARTRGTVTSTAGDERQTPKWLFDACARSWGPFVIDLAATKENALCDQWLGPGGLREDALAGSGIYVEPYDVPMTHRMCHYNKRAWLNPPYSRGNVGRFLYWASEQAMWGWTICTLLPLDPSTQWWKESIGPLARPFKWIGEIVAVQDVPGKSGSGRVFFDFPGGTTNTKANFPSVVVVFRPPFEAE